MQTILLSHEEVAHRAQQMYESGIHQQVHSEDNIGKMVIIDIETGKYEVDEDGLVSATHLSEKNPTARLFGIRIGYDVSASLGGVIERIKKFAFWQLGKNQRLNQTPLDITDHLWFAIVPRTQGRKTMSPILCGV